MWSARAKTDLHRLWRASHVKFVGIFECSLVAIARVVKQNNFLISFDFESVYFCICGSGATKVNYRSCPTHDFFDGSFCVRIKVVEPNFALILIVGERNHAVCNCVASRLVASHNQKDKKTAEFLTRESLAVDDCMHHHARQIVCWVCQSSLAECLGVREHADGGFH